MNLLIYYGYPSSFNNSTNAWILDKVADDLAKYELIVLAAGLQEPSHPDHDNTLQILDMLRVKIPYGQVFGYVQTDQDFGQFKQQAAGWRDKIGVTGIFMDNAGYDFGTIREDFNSRVGFVHSLGMNCFANAWNVNHVAGVKDDPSYPNSQYNAHNADSLLGENDWYLQESFAVNTETTSEPYASHSGYETAQQWTNRFDEADYIRNSAGINIAGISIVDQSDPDEFEEGQQRAEFAHVAATMAHLQAWGTAAHNYGASTGETRYWPVTPIEVGAAPGDISIEAEGDERRRYFTDGNLSLDFTQDAQAYAINNH